MFWTIEVDGVKSLNYAQNFHEMVEECNESFEFICLFPIHANILMQRFSCHLIWKSTEDLKILQALLF